MSNKEVYILVIITSIIIYATKTRIFYKNKYGEGVTCFIVDLTIYLNYNTIIMQFLVPYHKCIFFFSRLKFF